MIECYFDGCCEPKNPGGNMGFGFVVLEDGEEIYSHSSFKAARPENTNNSAEYMALINCLFWLQREQMQSASIMIHGDSQLVIKQMNTEWGIKGGSYVKYAKMALEYDKDFSNISYHWVPREMNERADILSKKELTKRGIKENNWKKYKS